MRAWIDKLAFNFIEWLTCDVDRPPEIPLSDFADICQALRPGDVLLLEGRSRVSKVISTITRSRWTHAALYIGYFNDIKITEQRKRVIESYQANQQDQLIIESVMGKGVIISPLSSLRQEHIRICRPTGLLPKDVNRVIACAIGGLGFEYDTRQILDLARFLFPWGILPRRWHSTLFTYKAGVPTRLSCSRLLAESFASVYFPILPHFLRDDSGKLIFIRRNPQLFTPSDFDYSPFFETIKYPIIKFTDGFNYRHLAWVDDVVSNNEKKSRTVERNK